MPVEQSPLGRYMHVRLSQENPLGQTSYYGRPGPLRQLNAQHSGNAGLVRDQEKRQAAGESNRTAAEAISEGQTRSSQRAYRPPVGKSFYAHVHDLGLKRM